jgi:hypothetical protein
VELILHASKSDRLTVGIKNELFAILPDLVIIFLHLLRFCFALNFAQRARCAAAILRRDDADIVRLGVATLALTLTFAQRAL